MFFFFGLVLQTQTKLQTPSPFYGAKNDAGFGLCAFIFAGQLANVSVVDIQFILAFAKSSIRFIGFNYHRFAFLFFGIFDGLHLFEVCLFLKKRTIFFFPNRTLAQTFERTLDCTCGACPLPSVCKSACQSTTQSSCTVSEPRVSRRSARVGLFLLVSN